jgi:hypothetical protein
MIEWGYAKVKIVDLDIDALVDAAVASLPRTPKGRVVPPGFLREIGEEDLPALRTGRRENAQRRPLQKVRHTHHLAARCLAEGKSVVETSFITGYTPTRISDLKSDPTFQELMAHYKGEVDAKWLNVQERLATLSMAVTEEMQERLENLPESFSNEELRRWAETLLDRSGQGKTSTVRVESRELRISLIEQIKRESTENSSVKLLAAE